MNKVVKLSLKKYFDPSGITKRHDTLADDLANEWCDTQEDSESMAPEPVEGSPPPRDFTPQNIQTHKVLVDSLLSCKWAATALIGFGDWYNAHGLLKNAPESLHALSD